MPRGTKVWVVRAKTPGLVWTMGCPDGVLPVTTPLRLAPAESVGFVPLLLLRVAEAVLVAAGLGNWMAVILTLIWLPVGKCAGAFGVDTEEILEALKLCAPTALFTAFEVVALVAVVNFMLVAVAVLGFWAASFTAFEVLAIVVVVSFMLVVAAVPDFWAARPFPLANPALAVTGDVSLPSGAWTTLPAALDTGLIKVACKTFPTASFVCA